MSKHPNLTQLLCPACGHGKFKIADLTDLNLRKCTKCGKVSKWDELCREKIGLLSENTISPHKEEA